MLTPICIQIIAHKSVHVGTEDLIASKCLCKGTDSQGSYFIDD